MIHEKRTLAELMQENDKKESRKKESSAPAAKHSENEKLPPSRQGKSRLETWVSRDAKKQLRLLAVEEEKRPGSVATGRTELVIQEPRQTTDCVMKTSHPR